MQIWPAIDIRGGKCVRLQQGDYGRETVFGEDPVEVARQWVDQGADCLHLVDLDGARDGHVVNREVIQAIVTSAGVPCELGGGIRDEATIRTWLELGIQQLVVGTRAVQDETWFRAMAQEFPGRLVLGIDARNGWVATQGWLETSQVSAIELAQRFADISLAAIVYTDISKDGMLVGPNLEAMSEMKAATRFPVIASGGVGCLEDLLQLAARRLDGCIVGRALYEGRVQLSSALAAIGKTQA